jgi:aldehyde:ferredoxin oxidoreductase
MYGWAGQILHISLSDRKVTPLETETYSKNFIGGLGVGEKLYWDMARRGYDAFHPENPLILMTGPLAATPAPSAARLVVCGKSPCIYPETFVSANLGGFFAPELKRAGYDGIVVQGKADRPVFIDINDHTVTINNASHLWGQGNLRTREELKRELGNKVRILSIGPGGENRTRIGIIFSDVGSSASMGFGSVMGAKNLKAITVKGNNTIPVASPDRIHKIRKRFQAMTGEGFFNLFGNPIMLPGSTIEKKVHCHGCPQGCWRTIHQSAGGSRDIRKCQIGNFYMMWDRKLHGELTEASFSAPTMLNDYGVCGIDMVLLLLLIDRCAQQGIITVESTGLDFERIGSVEFLEFLLRKVCAGEGFGAVLAEGALRASEIIGTPAREITRNLLTYSGRAIAYGPKVFSIAAPIYATEPRPSITELHEVCEPLTKWAIWYTSHGEKSYLSTEVLRRIAAAFWGSEVAVDFSTYDGKARAARLVQNRQFLKESLNLCDFAWPVYDDAGSEDHVGDPTLADQLFTAVTGWKVDPEELDLIAERLVTLNRAILLREGHRGRQDDRLPEFMFVEREEMMGDVFGMYNPELYLPGRGDEVISRKGKAVDREQFQQMMDEYYRLRGWDSKTGYLKKETLQKLDLHDAGEYCDGTVM